MPEVSVIVPTHNRRALLLLTLRSILLQSDVDLELIVVDDGSIDGTGTAVEQLADSRARVVRNEVAQGVSAARDRGRAETTGDWIAFCDDDDLWAPTKLRSQLRAAEATRRDWAYVGVVNVDHNLRIVSGRPPPDPGEAVRELPHRNVIPGGGSNVIVRSELLKKMPPFDPRLKNTEDWEMWIRLANVGPPACDSRPLIAYRIHSGNASLDTKAILQGIKIIEQIHDTTADMGTIHRWLAESCLRTGHRLKGAKHLGLAALNGQYRGVAGDVRDILARKIPLLEGRHLRAIPSEVARWREQSAPWLGSLRSLTRDDV